MQRAEHAAGCEHGDPVPVRPAAVIRGEEAPVADKKSFLLRISPDLYDALAVWAGEELRSMNGQIEFLLRQALVDARRLTKK